MNLISIILIAIGLAMDAVAVSIAGGLKLKTKKIKQALKAGVAFGLFQAVMPLLG